MNLLRSLACLLLFTVPGKAARLVVSSGAPDAGYFITLIAAYQVGDEIWLTSDLERHGLAAPEVASFPRDVVDADLPTLLAKHRGDPDLVPGGVPLWMHREQVAGFDFSAGDGWVDTDAVGWVYARRYPWVYHPELGWLWVVEGPIVSDAFPEEPDHGAPAEAKLSFYFHSQNYGWLWKTPYSEKFIVIGRDGFHTIAEIKSGTG